MSDVQKLSITNSFPFKPCTSFFFLNKNRKNASFDRHRLWLSTSEKKKKQNKVTCGRMDGWGKKELRILFQNLDFRQNNNMSNCEFYSKTWFSDRIIIRQIDILLFCVGKPSFGIKLTIPFYLIHCQCPTYYGRRKLLYDINELTSFKNASNVLQTQFVYFTIFL